VRWGGTPAGGMMKLDTSVELPDAMNRANLYICLMCSLRASRGQKTGFPFEMHMAVTTLPCATALASDNIACTTRDSLSDSSRLNTTSIN
jgi:hypothetical protein